MAQPGKARMEQHKEKSGRAEAVTRLAVEVFGNLKEAERWLNAPLKTLAAPRIALQD